ncbi:MAG TPA: cytochrome c-type biogenesis protein CcmH [Anaerolineaceae bacterium]|nr:cytochrome c-type biogenesis protein CcmH [Anaerolineaceae bacterium]
MKARSTLFCHIFGLFSTKKLLFALLVLLLSGLIIPNNYVLGQSGTPSDDEINAIAKELYCPVCENIPLDVCPTQACAQWRALIREKLIDGWTKEEIKQYFVDQYGDRVLAQPPARGLNWLIYILPPLIFVGGIVVVYTNLKKIRKAPEKVIQETNIENEEKYLQEFEKALEDLDNQEN